MTPEERIAELEARIDTMSEVMLEMATRLDGYEQREAAQERLRAESRRKRGIPPSEDPPEIREWIGTAQWSGPAADYWSNAAEINHEISLAIQKMAIDADEARNHPDTPEIGQKAIEAEAVESPNA